MCEMVDSAMLIHLSDCYKTQEVCNKYVKKDSEMLKFVPDYFETQQMCKKAVKNCCLQ